MIIPKSKSLVVSVPKTANFHIPEGQYQAKITNVKKQYVEKVKGTGETIKILFELQVPSMTKTVNLAKAEYRLDMNPGSELHNILTRLFGKQTMLDAAGDSFDLEQMVGKDVEVEIEHVITSRRDDYAFPLVKVRDIKAVEAKP